MFFKSYLHNHQTMSSEFWISNKIGLKIQTFHYQKLFVMTETFYREPTENRFTPATKSKLFCSGFYDFGFEVELL